MYPKVIIFLCLFEHNDKGRNFVSVLLIIVTLVTHEVELNLKTYLTKTRLVWRNKFL